MQNLVNELMQPSTGANGEILAPSTVKRRAANTIMQLHNQGQADLQARLRLQAELAEARDAYVKHYGPPLEYCRADYNEVMNQDYYANFT